MTTAWVKVDLTFLDRTSRAERTEAVLLEVVSSGGTAADPDILFQHEGGTHRVVPAHDIVRMEQHGRIA